MRRVHHHSQDLPAGLPPAVPMRAGSAGRRALTPIRAGGTPQGSRAGSPRSARSQRSNRAWLWLVKTK